ncbi:MAG TPA: autoinducer binding domain-containing protein [Burkholderiaceae bacterium]|nr:autoinducer binding domain-containing protein [Burkholderiaceae bacterium]
MNHWADELTQAASSPFEEAEAFSAIQAAATALGFEGCCFWWRTPLPVTQPKLTFISNHPQAWQRRYQEAGYIHIDPVVLHGHLSQQPLLWTDELFATTPTLRAEAKKHGLIHGWSQAKQGFYGLRSMLSLTRATHPITVEELAAKQPKMSLLVNMAHMLLAQPAPGDQRSTNTQLTKREIEIMKWTVDGKTVAQVAEILLISTDTVKFHIKNAMAKLDAPNKVTAAVKALTMGLLA